MCFCGKPNQYIWFDFFFSCIVLISFDFKLCTYPFLCYLHCSNWPHNKYFKQERHVLPRLTTAINRNSLLFFFHPSFWPPTPIFIAFCPLGFPRPSRYSAKKIDILTFLHALGLWINNTICNIWTYGRRRMSREKERERVKCGESFWGLDGWFYLRGEMVYGINIYG